MPALSACLSQPAASNFLPAARGEGRSQSQLESQESFTFHKVTPFSFYLLLPFEDFHSFKTEILLCFMLTLAFCTTGLKFPTLSFPLSLFQLASVCLQHKTEST